ncbi:hypothetical protein [Cupriavidus campinensis]|uniref:Uncharacterized protein n=1 Tax=Cupriavidus campinensis TaxID=151783 RepID=A0AAE9I566_9BURK|nr:hypothetical protein [Cupriavidus campinensis]URF05275.1 hypothetical protein M5D45_05490 [Cupriavidus campinensis]
MTTPNNKACCNYKSNTASPRSYLRYFERVAFARNLAQIHIALAELVPRLLGRGQAPEVVANDLAQLAPRGLADAVLPVVNERAMAMRGAA